MVLRMLAQLMQNNDQVEYWVKRATYPLLKSPLFTHNPLYRHLYYRMVRNKAPALLRQIQSVVIENTNHCNIACYFCPHPEMQRPKGRMEMELYKEIIRQCRAEQVPCVMLYGMGEPLVDKDYPERVRYAFEQGIPVIDSNTNAILLTPAKSAALVDAGLTTLHVSVDATSAETYQRIHDKDKFDVIVENLTKLKEYKQKTGKTNPKVILRFRISERNRHELASFRKSFGHLGDSLKVDMNIISWPGSSFLDPLQKDFRLLRFPCANLWRQLYIAHDGRVGLCCLDYEFREVLGDVRQQSLREVWQGAAMEEKRRLHMEGRSHEVSLCRTCLLNTQLLSPWWI